MDDWLRQQLSQVETLINSRFYENYYKTGLTPHTFYEAVEEISDAVDTYSSPNPREMDYDFLGMSVAYDSWYLPRRIGDALVIAKDILSIHRVTHEVVDIGAGSGAICVALILVKHYQEINGFDKDVVLEYTPIDSSDFGLGNIKWYMEKLLESYPCNFRMTEPVVTDWKNESFILVHTNKILVSGYLFSIHDVNDPTSPNLLYNKLIQACEISYFYTSLKKRMIYDKLDVLAREGFLIDVSLEDLVLQNLPDAREITISRRKIHNREKDAGRPLKGGLLLQAISFRSEKGELKGKLFDNRTFYRKYSRKT